jgi:uncharacterized membrane protein YqjE
VVDAINRRTIVSQATRSLWADLRDELRSLAGELREMFRLRWELLRIEAVADLKNVRRLLIATAVSGVLVLTSLPLMISAAADALAGVWQIARWGWLLIFAATLVILAAGIAFLAWRHFRRRIVGFQETLEELNEDRVWLEEWLRKNKQGAR